MDTGSTDPIQSLLTALLTPFGAVAALCGISLLIAAAGSRFWRWVTVGGALWASALGQRPIDPTGLMLGQTLFGPLETFRVQGRPIAVCLLIGLVAPTFLSDRGWRKRIIMGAPLALLAFELLFCSRVAMASLFARAAGSFAIYLLIFIVLTRGVGNWLQEPKDVLCAVRAIALAGTIFAITNAGQMAINRGAAEINGRFCGTAGNPQHAATCIACVLPAILFLIIRKEEPKFVRFSMSVVATILGLLLITTGSRTGLLMTVVATILLFRRWLGQFVKLAVIFCMFGILGVLVAPEGMVQTDRLTSTEDTRSEVWRQLEGQFLSSPILGQMTDEVSIRENSYLSTAARMGIVGLIPMGITLVAIFRTLNGLRKVRPMLGEYTMLTDLASAGLISIGVGAMTEGYLLAILSIHILLIYLLLSIIAFLLDYAEQVSMAPVEEVNPYAEFYMDDAALRYE